MTYYPHNLIVLIANIYHQSASTVIWIVTGTNKSTPLTYYKYNLLSPQHTVKILSANSTCIPDIYNKTDNAHINATSKHNHKSIVAVEER